MESVIVVLGVLFLASTGVVWLWKHGEKLERQLLDYLQQVEQQAKDDLSQLAPFHPGGYGTEWLPDSDWQNIKQRVEHTIQHAEMRALGIQRIQGASKTVQAHLQTLRQFLLETENFIQASNRAWLAKWSANLEPEFSQLETDIKACENLYIRESLRCRLAPRIGAFWKKVERLPSQLVQMDANVRLWQSQAKAWKRAFSRNAMDKRNAAFVISEAKRYGPLFDAAGKQPLTDEQREACVTNEDRNLLLAGAGTGKTSTMVGRALYLVKSGLATEDEILMLAFNKNAAEEMQKRINKSYRITAKTFHSLGLSILADCGMPTEVPPWVKDEQRFNDVLDKILRDHWLLRILLTIWTQKPERYRGAFDFKSFKEYQAYLKQFEFRTIQGEIVKSYEECVVANCLFRHGIQYRYEDCYPPGPPPTSKWKQYRPDFHLLGKDVWLEHFAIKHDRNGNEVSPFGSWYVNGARQKRIWHKQNHTRLLETTSEQYRANELEESLKRQLEECGYELKEKSEEELLQTLRQVLKSSKLSEHTHNIIKRFKEMGGKAGLETMTDQSPRIRQLLDLLQRIFEAYEKELRKKNGIDFEDMIQQAAQLVREGQWQIPYKHILVDEFQDISPSRAELLRALLKQRQDCVLFAVGDDWQAIYGFTGSDSRMTTQFGRYFAGEGIGYRSMQLTRTFRFGDGMCKLSSSFVTVNPKQSQRCLCSMQRETEPIVVDLGQRRTEETNVHVVFRALDWLKEHGHEGNESILVLGRTKAVLPSKFGQKNLHRAWTGKIECTTAHKSKGMEADNVIILNANSGKDGFPHVYHSQSNVWEPLEKWLDTTQADEGFPNAEERRLFYVALTRARKRVFLDRGVESENKSFFDEVMLLANMYSPASKS